MARTAAIVSDHPEIRRLFGPERGTAGVGVLLVVAQTAVSLWAPSLSTGWYVAVAYVVGATFAQALFLAVHEVAGHDLAFRRPASNRALAMLLNLPLVFPFVVSFRQHHRDHHAHAGVAGVDADLPTAFERRWFGSSRVGRGAWLSCQLIAYALRPLAARPKKITGAHAANAAIQAIWVASVVAWAGGWAPVRFLLLSMWLAGGLHPTAGHFLAEHYALSDAQRGGETFSYYGPLNRVTFNVGAHREHHDFPTIPWTRIMAVRVLAPEYYPEGDAGTCPSWVGVLLSFVWHPGAMDARVVRKME